jgi:hypothetical protein
MEVSSRKVACVACLLTGVDQGECKVSVGEGSLSEVNASSL